jgi:mRNA-degrading endonuclease toxin of MazEF toxin-antitoxin module
VSGKVTSLSGSCPALSFSIKDRDVYTSSATDFKNGSCRNIGRDSQVSVEGVEMPDKRIRADKVTTLDDDPQGGTQE